jgi:hypothetical protein
MIKVGLLDEIRAYNEMIPVVVVPILLILNRLLLENTETSQSHQSDIAATIEIKAAA